MARERRTADRRGRNFIVVSCWVVAVETVCGVKRVLDQEGFLEGSRNGEGELVDGDQSKVRGRRDIYGSTAA